MGSFSVDQTFSIDLLVDVETLYLDSGHGENTQSTVGPIYFCHVNMDRNENKFGLPN